MDIIQPIAAQRNHGGGATSSSFSAECALENESPFLPRLATLSSLKTIRTVPFYFMFRTAFSIIFFNALNAFIVYSLARYAEVLVEKFDLVVRFSAKRHVQGYGENDRGRCFVKMHRVRQG